MPPLPESVAGLVACAAGRAFRLGDGALAREVGVAEGMGDMAIVLDFEDARRGPTTRPARFAAGS